MPFVAITFTVPRPGKPAIDFATVSGEEATAFLRAFRNVNGFDPVEGNEYKEHGLRIDRIER